MTYLLDQQKGGLLGRLPSATNRWHTNVHRSKVGACFVAAVQSVMRDEQLRERWQHQICLQQEKPGGKELAYFHRLKEMRR